MKRSNVITLILLLGMLLAGPVMLGGCEQYDPQVLQQYADQAEVIKPQALRDRVAAMLRAAADRYA